MEYDIHKNEMNFRDRTGEKRSNWENGPSGDFPSPAISHHEASDPHPPVTNNLLLPLRPGASEFGRQIVPSHDVEPQHVALAGMDVHAGLPLDTRERRRKDSTHAEVRIRVSGEEATAAAGREKAACMRRTVDVAEGGGTARDLY